MTRQMIDHGIRWIGAIPSAWKLVTLKSLVSVQNGDWGSDPAEIGPSGSVLTCYRKADFTQTSTVESGETLRRIARKPFVRCSDILLEKSGGGDVTPVGAVAIVLASEPAACSNFLARLRANEGSVEPKFIWRFLLAVHASPQIWSMFKQTTGIQNIDMGSLSTLEVPYPDILEQRRITVWLDLQTTRIDKRRKLLAKKRVLLGELRKSIIYEAVTGKIDLSTDDLSSCGQIAPMAGKESGVNWIGAIPAAWELRRFKDAGSFQTGQDHKSLSVGSVPVFGSSSEPFAWVERPLCSRKAIAIGRKGTIDRPFVIEPDFWAVDTCMFHTVPRKDFSLEYLGYWINIVPWKEISTQTALPSLTQTDANNVVIAYPSVDEQRRIANYLDQRLRKINRQITLIDQLDELLQQQRKAIIHEAVTGKIDLSGAPLA